MYSPVHKRPHCVHQDPGTFIKIVTITYGANAHLSYGGICSFVNSLCLNIVLSCSWIRMEIPLKIDKVGGNFDLLEIQAYHLCTCQYTMDHTVHIIILVDL